MRRTFRALSVAALAGAALAVAGPAATADPAAETSPDTVRPGGTVTVSVTCDKIGGTVPDTLDATSQAFEDGTVRLQRVTGEDGGPAYRGTARITAGEQAEGDPAGTGPDAAWTVDGTCPGASGGKGSPWSASYSVTRPDAPDDGPDAGSDDVQGTGPCTAGRDCGQTSQDTPCRPGQPCEEPGQCPGPAADTGPACAGGGRDCGQAHGPSSCTGGRTCPGSVQGDAAAGCPPPTVQHGVAAGQGGTFDDSVPALAAGAALIAAACGAVAYRLHRPRRREDG